MCVFTLEQIEYIKEEKILLIPQLSEKKHNILTRGPKTSEHLNSFL